MSRKIKEWINQKLLSNTMKDDKTIQLNYLEEERKKLWAKILILEQEIAKRPSDYEREAVAASKKASENRNKTEEAKNLTLSYLNTSQNNLDEIQVLYNSAKYLSDKIIQYDEDSKNKVIGINESINELLQRKETLESMVAEVEELFNGHESLSTKIESLESIFDEGTEYSAKIELLNKSLIARKAEIDTLYYDIIGYTDIDKETGKSTLIEGKKQQLEKSYLKIKADFEHIDEEIKDFHNSTVLRYNSLKEDKEKEFTETVTKWKIEYKNTLKEINDLMPHALTAGLSYAYSEKKLAEEKERIGHKDTFTYGIWGLLAVSLIPFGVSISLLFDQKTLLQVINELPRIVLSILPIYIPVLWVAYSANRKMNLSKRLIEEYSHKEVLSKTYEGLSSQINNITDTIVSNDLRNKLLFNILEVSSENPGKLISDYNKSDHPIMDALDKSVKLTNAVTKLSKIPGFSKLASALESKSKEILDKETKKAEEGLDIVQAKE